MKKLIKKILKEEVENWWEKYSKPTENQTSYIVFVAGTNKTGISHQKQYNAFLNSLGAPPPNTEIKLFNYNDHLHSNSELFQFLKENLLNVEALVLFSAACSMGNKLTPRYVPHTMVYCIEPWATENGKLSWDNIYHANFYVNCCTWRRGKGAMKGIPEENKNNLTGTDAHINALKDAVSKIF